MSNLGSILDLILKLLDTLTPDEVAKIKKAIEEKEKQNEKTKERLKKALVDGDIPTLNIIFSELFGL